MSDGIDGNRRVTNCKLCRHYKPRDLGNTEQCFIRAGNPSDGVIDGFCRSFEKSHVRQTTPLSDIKKTVCQKSHVEKAADNLNRYFSPVQGDTDV